jgi:2-keto-4-pentenoate hydratase/2-oxohepta-3-ene-1,7-dioic acid hydratase in catechol pathway
MKLLRCGPIGREKPACLDSQGRPRDLSSVIQDITPETLSPDSLAALRALDPDALPLLAADHSRRIGAPCARVGKFIGVGLNYKDHAAETGLPAPVEPILFNKWCAPSGPCDAVMLPRDSEKTDWEVELGIVMGARARHVALEAALSHVAGYCVVNDVSERAYQTERGGTWDKGKGCDTFGPIGPWLVTADEIPDPQTLGMWLEVNGHRYQSGHTSNMIFGVAYLIHYISQFTTLEPGDLIATGTPAGVGMGQKPPVYLRPGDRIRLGVDGLGVQSQDVVAWKD